MKIKAELSAFEASDRLTLQGLLYNPGGTKKVLIYTHGCGSSSIFNNPDFVNLAGQMLNREGIAFFPFNNRGSYALHWRKKIISKNKSEKIPSGSSYELIKDCVPDFDGAIKFLRSKGFKEFYLAGHSTGANKVALYDYLKKGKTPVKKYILYGGGDDSGIYKKELGKSFDKYLKICRKKVKQGEGLKLIPDSWLKRPYSYQSLLDIMEPDGHYDVFPFNAAKKGMKSGYFKALSKIKKPSQLVFGEQDPVNYLPIGECLDLLKRKLKNRKNFSYKVITGGDHSCSGVEAKLFKAWIEFIKAK